jgi:hypothetical protein
MTDQNNNNNIERCQSIWKSKKNQICCYRKLETLSIVKYLIKVGLGHFMFYIFVIKYCLFTIKIKINVLIKYISIICFEQHVPFFYAYIFFFITTK